MPARRVPDPDPGPAPIDPLLSLLRACVVRIDAADGFRGTGFLVAPQEILTCAHVVHGVDDVHVSGDGWSATATITQRLPDLEAADPAAAFYPLPDVALLQLQNAPDGLTCVRLEVDCPAEETPVRLEAFTVGEHGPAVIGRSPAATTYEGPIAEGEHTLFKLAGGQVLDGYSGAPLLNLRTGGVCGLVDSSRDTRSDLGGFGVPLAAVSEELAPTFERNRAAQADGRWALAVEAQAVQAQTLAGARARIPLLSAAVELAGSVEDRQSDLLRPRHRVVPMVGRERVASTLAVWREAGELLEVAFLTGGGGFGKTRLAVEACLTAEAAGWTAGLLDGDATRGNADALVSLAEWPGRLFVAIDYAETRAEVVRELLRELQRRPARPAVRLLLICRQALSRSELEDLFGGGDAREELGAVLSRADPFRLPDEELDRHELFHAAAGAFAPLLAAASVPQRHVALRADHFARPLIVSVAALLACQDDEIDVDALSEEQLLLEVIDRHEARYWQLWNDRLAMGLSSEDRQSAVAIATLTGAHAETDALALVSIVPGFHDASAERKRQVARWLSSLYGTGRLDTADVIVPLDPDPLAEALVARELRARPDLVEAVLKLERDAQVAQALTVLTRLSERREDVRAHARAALDESLPALVARVIEHQADDEGLLGALTAAVLALQPAKGAASSRTDLGSHGRRFRPLSLTLGALTVDCFRALAEVNADADADGWLPQLASSLNQQSGRLEDAGRPTEGLAPIAEAVKIYRELAEAEPERFLANLAASLNNQSNRLADAGHPADGLAPVDEAAEIYRQLAESEPDTYRPELASSLNNQSNMLAEAGRPADGLEPIEQAVAIYRELIAAEPDQYRADLATALNNQANRLAQAGRPADGLGPIEGAIAFYRQLVAANPDRYRANLATSLNNQANMMAEAGRPADALASIEEAVEIYRELSEAEPQRFLANLSMSLNNQSNMLAEAGRPADGIAPIVEAVGYRRQLAGAEPQRFLPDLATSLNNHSNRLAQTGRPVEALAAIEEAVGYRRQLAGAEPQRFLPDLAGSLNNQANRLSQAGQPADALGPIDESVGIYRDLAAAEPRRFAADLAGSLNNQANLRGEAGRAADGLAPVDEAVAMYRELAKAEPRRFLANVAMSLNNRATLLARADRAIDALGPLEEAIAIYRELVEAEPRRFLANLAGSLSNQANLRALAGRSVDALASVDEAIAIYRELVEAEPRRFLANLAEVLNYQSNLRVHAGCGAEALEPIEAAIAATDGDRAQGILLDTRARYHFRMGDLPPAVDDARRALVHLERTDDGLLRGRVRHLLRAMRGSSPRLFDDIWERAAEGRQPVWLIHLDPERAVVEAAVAWIETTTWKASEQTLADQADVLVTDAAIAAVEHLIDANPATEMLLVHLQLLRRAQERGVAAAYEEFRVETARQRLLQIAITWLMATPDDEQLLLTEHAAEVLSEPVEHALEALAHEHPEDPAILERLGRLTLARIGDPSLVGAADAPPFPSLEASAAEPTEQTLALSRIAVAHLPGEPIVHLAHAVVSAATGRDDEPHHAIQRCRENSNKWERRELSRRLTALQQAHPDLAVALGELATELERD
jgi:RecA/RadA recombinase